MRITAYMLFRQFTNNLSKNLGKLGQYQVQGKSLSIYPMMLLQPAVLLTTRSLLKMPTNFSGTLMKGSVILALQRIFLHLHKT